MTRFLMTERPPLLRVSQILCWSLVVLGCSAAPEGSDASTPSRDGGLDAAQVDASPDSLSPRPDGGLDATQMDAQSPDASLLSVSLEGLRMVDGESNSRVAVVGSETLGSGVSGIFVWSPSTPKSDADLGTLFDATQSVFSQGNGDGDGVWRREFEGAAEFRWWGARGEQENGDSVVDALALSRSFAGPMRFDPGAAYYVALDEKAVVQWSALHGMSGTLNFTNGLDTTALVFANVSRIENVTFDGQDHSFGPDARDYYLVQAHGESVSLLNTHFRNVLGSSEHATPNQYALGLDWNSDITIERCSFRNIRTYTFDGNRAGFVGGVFINDDHSFRVAGQPLRQATHRIIDSIFEDIHTLTNVRTGVTFPDSDGIRYYLYGIEEYRADPAAMQRVVGTTLEGRDLRFVNVLKSGLKLNHVSAVLENIDFEVTELHESENVYCALRYQVGYGSLNVTNLNVYGRGIRFGLLYLGEGAAVVQDMRFESTYDTAMAFLVGAADVPRTSSLSLSNIFSSKGIAVIRGAESITFSNTRNLPGTTDTFWVRGIVPGYTLDLLRFDECDLHGSMTSYDRSRRTIINRIEGLDVAVETGPSIEVLSRTP